MRDIVEMAELMGQLGYPTSAKDMEQRYKNISADPRYYTMVAEYEGKVVDCV